VVEAVLHHLSLNPGSAPLIPYFPFTLIKALNVPPKPVVHLPWQYRLFAFLGDTPLGWLFVEPGARKKYNINQH
jgi:hypothetical protein